VPEVCCGAGFPEEPLQQLVVGELLSHHFDGNLSIQVRVAPEIHGSHSAMADAAQDFILANLRSHVANSAR